jgi:hypothetical protein
MHMGMIEVELEIERKTKEVPEVKQLHMVDA